MQKSGNTFEYKISICLIVKNEEKNLERCLESVVELVNCGLAEIIIVDTGSSDNTIKIAKGYTDKLYSYAWKNDFADARNYSISISKGEYLFIIDADEEVEANGIERIKSFFSSKIYSDYGVMYFKEKNFMDKALNKYAIFTRAFIFKHTTDFCFFSAIHEQPNIRGKRINLDVNILHYGYIMDEKLQEKKFVRNITLLKEELKKSPDNLYIRYQSAISYHAHRDYKEAKDEIDLVINKIGNREFDKLFLLYYDAAVRIYREDGLYKEALELCNIGLSYQSDFIDLLFYKAAILFAMEKDKEALAAIEEYLKLLVEFKEHDIYNDSRFLFYHLDSRDEALNMALVCCYVNNEYNRFLEYVDKIECLDILKDKFYVILQVYIKTKNYSKLIDFYRKKVQLSKNENNKLIFKYFIYRKLCETDNEEIKCLQKEISIGCSELEYRNLQFSFLEAYNFNNADVVTASFIVNDLVELVENCKLKSYYDVNRVRLIKIAIQFIITRTINSNQIKNVPEEKIFKVIEKYIELGLMFKDDDNVMDEKEKTFFNLFEDGLHQFQRGEVLKGVQMIKKGVETNNVTARMMEIYLAKYLPIYEHSIEMKKYIQKLVEQGNLKGAETLLDEYEKYLTQDIDNYSIRAVIRIMENKLEAAEKILKQGIRIHGDDFDLLYNLAYIYEMTGNNQKATEYYKNACMKTESEIMKKNIKDKLKQIYWAEKEWRDCHEKID